MTDFLIIGGGVYGAATAWALAKAGAAVHLLERQQVACRASGGPGRRGVRANGRDLRELPLMRLAYERWPSLHAELGAAPFYDRTGHLLVIESEAALPQAEARVTLQKGHGVPSRLLERSELLDLEPHLAKTVVAAIHCPDDGVADHAATTRAYAEAARQAGATVEEGVHVATLEATAVVTANGRRIEAKRGILVLANSAVADLVAPWIDLPVWNETFQVLVSAPLEHVPFRQLIGHDSRTVSLKTEGSDRVMISGGWPGRWDPEEDRGVPLPDSIASNVAEAVAVLPGLAGIEIETADASHQEAVSIDDIPVIDRLPGAETVLYATGWCGHGWAIAPVVADLIASWALTGERPALLAPFSHSRFGS